MGAAADALVDRLAESERWPLPEEKAVLDVLRERIAFRENDRDYLRNRAGWKDDGRLYRIDPLAERISSAFAALSAGTTPTITPANESDAGNWELIEEGNRFGTELGRSAIVKSSEGEVWWRIFKDERVADVPMVDWRSRATVIPEYSGPHLVAVACIDRLRDRAGSVWRHFEVHDSEDVRNVLFRGGDDHLGNEVDLALHPETEDLAETYTNPIAELMVGRIVNRMGADAKLGKSDYDGIEDFLLELNECLTTGGENRRLVAKKKMVVPESALDENGELPNKEVIVAEALGEGVSADKTSGPFVTLEYTFDAVPLITWQDSIAAKALTRIGIMPQFTGMPAGQEGYATTGTALRIRLLPTLAAGQERDQGYVDELPVIMARIQLVDAAPEADGGFGRSWADAGSPPEVQRGPQLPEDPTERDARLASNVTARVMSRETAVREQHPGWSDEQVQDELDAISEDGKAEAASGLGSLLPSGS